MDMTHQTYQLNPLVNAQKNFNVMETRLFYLGLQDINPHLTDKDKYYDEKFPDTFIPSSKLKELFGHGQYLSEIKKACKKLIGTSIEINYENDFDLYTVFQHIRYKDEKGLYIKFNDDMRPFILDIYKGYKKYGFTKVEMQQVFALDSAYAMRLLELILQYNGKKKDGIITRNITIDELRKKLSVPAGSYKRMKDLRKNVLDLPINEIERKTNYTITYETIKEGRSIVAIEFKCNCNKIKQDDDYTETIEVESYEEKLEEAGQEKLMDYPSIAEQKANDELYKKMKGYGFSLDTIGILLQDYCGGNIGELKARLKYGELRAREDIKKKKLKDNKVAGYLRKAIEQNWLGQARAEEQAQAKELEATATNADWDAWARDAMSDALPAPDVPERPLDPNNPMEGSVIGMIKGEIKNHSISKTTKDILKKRGLTFQRFREIYGE